MESKLERGQFVHVVASVDLEKGTGEIRYVNPATTAIIADPNRQLSAAEQRVEMSVEDAAGKQKDNWHPVLRFRSAPVGKAPALALIQEDIRRASWMSVVRLFVDQREVSKYQAGEPPVRPGLVARYAPRGMGPAIRALGGMLGATQGPQLKCDPTPDRPDRRQLRVDMETPPRAGVTYTVQVQPAGSNAWQTIAVGRKTPQAEIDRNQFPGANSVNVRVLQTTGFDEEVMAERAFDLEK